MKLSVITDEISQEFEHALDVMLEYEVRGAELRGLWGTNIGELSSEQVARAKNALAERGMVVSALSSPFYKCDLSTAEATEKGPLHLAKARGYGEQMELLRRLCGVAHEFGTDLIRVFTFWRKGELTPEIEEQIVLAFDEPVRVASAEGITLAVENEAACYIGTGAEVARLVAEIDSPNVKVCWDPGNAFFAGEKPYPEGYDAVRPYLSHVHVKDAVVKPDGQLAWTVMGEGSIDYVGQFDALRKDGYQAYISLETHYVPASGDTEQGSRECLAALKRMV